MCERKIRRVTHDGTWVETVLYGGEEEGADVAEARGSVSRTCDRGERVIFEAGGGCVENLTSGARTRVGRENLTCMS